MKYLKFYENFNISDNYRSFDTLTDKDLHDIAKWGLLNDFESNGAWDEADWKEENIELAIIAVIDSFKLILNEDFPEGFKNTPDILKLYRMVVLESPEKLNKSNLGYSWFSNPNRINNPDFKQQMWHLKTTNLYLLTAEIPIKNVDIPRSLFQRDMVLLENEVVLKSDNNIKLINIKKLN